MRNSMILVPRGPKTDQNCFEERSESDLGSKLVLGPRKSANASCTAHPFGYYLGDLGRRFGHRWAPRGPKVKRFGTRDAPKSENITSRMRQQKKLKFQLNFVQKMPVSEWVESPEMLYIKAFRWVLSHYKKIKHLIENCHQHGIQNAYKIHQKLT